MRRASGNHSTAWRGGWTRLTPMEWARVLGPAIATAQVISCLELGKSASQCALEAGLGAAVGVLIGKALTAAGLSGPQALVLAGAAGWGQVGLEAWRWRRDAQERKAQEDAIKAQQEANRKRVDDIRKTIEAEIAALAPLRAEALARRAAAREQARLAKPAADSAKELLDSLRDLKAALETVAAACKSAEPLRKQIEQLVAEAKDKAKTVVDKINAADALAASCLTQEDADQIAWLLEGARLLGGEAIVASAQAEGLNNRLNTILEPAILDRARKGQDAVQHAEALAAKIAQDAATADSALEATRAAIIDSEQKGRELVQAKNAILARIAALRGAFPADLQGPFETLVGSATAAGSLPEEDLTGHRTLAREEATRAAEYSKLAQDLLSTIRGLPLCDGLTPADDLIAEAQQARTDALVYAGSDVPSKLQACQAKLKVAGLALTPPQAAIKPGGSVSFKATASFGDGSSRDVTAESTWSPASTFTGSQVGEFSVSATYGGQSAAATVRVEELRVTALAISPAQKTIKLNESVSFKAVATLEDGSAQTVTSEAMWAPGSSFTGTAEGTFAVAATYKGQQASAAVTVEGKKKREDGSPPQPPPPGLKGGYNPTDRPRNPAWGASRRLALARPRQGIREPAGDAHPVARRANLPEGLGGGEVTRIPRHTSPPPPPRQAARGPSPLRGAAGGVIRSRPRSGIKSPWGPARRPVGSRHAGPPPRTQGSGCPMTHCSRARAWGANPAGSRVRRWGRSRVRTSRWGQSRIRARQTRRRGSQASRWGRAVGP